MALNPAALAERSHEKRAFAVVSYLPEWRLAGIDWHRATSHSSHVILFSLEVGDWEKTTKSKPESIQHSTHINEQKKWALQALDRLPESEALAEARGAALANGCQLLLGFGGNGRSLGFGTMSTDTASRSAFIDAAVSLVVELGLDGVDYNWEYPGYDFRRGYLDKSLVQREYEGLASLVVDTRAAFDSLTAAGGQKHFDSQGEAGTAGLSVDKRFTVTLAYYPDGRQEQLLASTGAAAAADLLHIMSYDQQGQHSSMEFAKSAAAVGASKLPAAKLTLGLPFYGRRVRGGDWMSYEDLVQQHSSLDSSVDLVDEISFNGRDTISAKTRLAAELGLGGVMIWELGQDCRAEPVIRNGTTHVATCPDGRRSSLLDAISDAMASVSVERMPTGFGRAFDKVASGELLERVDTTAFFDKEL